MGARRHCPVSPAFDKLAVDNREVSCANQVLTVIKMDATDDVKTRVVLHC